MQWVMTPSASPSVGINAYLTKTTKIRHKFLFLPVYLTLNSNYSQKK